MNAFRTRSHTAGYTPAAQPDTGDGNSTLSSRPGGSTKSMARKTPWFMGMCGKIIFIVTTAADSVTERVEFTAPVAGGLEPEKSMVARSPCTVSTMWADSGWSGSPAGSQSSSASTSVGPSGSLANSARRRSSEYSMNSSMAAVIMPVP